MGLGRSLTTVIKEDYIWGWGQASAGTTVMWPQCVV